MKSLYICKLIIIGIIFQNCTTIHNGQIISLNYGQPVSPQNKAKGEASSVYFLGFGGGRKRLIMESAKDDLINNRPLEEGESYANINLDVSTSFLLIFAKSRFIITADVIPDSNFVASVVNPKKDNFFHVGDSIFNNRNVFVGAYRSRYSKLKIQVHSTIQGDDKLRTKDIEKSFKNSGSYKGYEVGQVISFYGAFPGSGTLVGLNENAVLVLEKTEELSVVKYGFISK